MDKTKAQLLEELRLVRARAAALEQAEIDRIKVESELRESEERYRHLVEYTVNWVWTIDSEGFHAFCNEAVTPLLGYHVDEILGTSVFSLIHLEDQAHIRTLLQESTAVKRGWRGIAIRKIHKDGSVRYFESTAKPILDADGQLKGFNGLDHDITERVHAERELTKYRDHLEQVAEKRRADFLASYEVLQQRDTMLQTVRVIAERLLKTDDWQRDINSILEALGTMANVDRVTVWEIVSVEDQVRALLRGLWEQSELMPTMDLRFHNIDVIETGFAPMLDIWKLQQPIYGHIKDLHPEEDGKQRLFQALGTQSYLHAPIVVQDNLWGIIVLETVQKEHDWTPHVIEAIPTAANMLGTVIDRQHIEHMYHTLVDHSLQGLAVIQNWQIIFCNQSFADMLGYNIEELLDLQAAQVQALVHPDDHEHAWGRYRKRQQGEQLLAECEFRTIRKDGSVRWVEQYASIIEYKGKPATQAVFIDITDRKQAEAVVRQSEEKFAAVFRSGPVAISLSLLDDGRIVDVNETFLNDLGYTREEVIGIPLIDLNIWTFPEQRDEFTRQLRDNGAIQNFEADFHRKSGDIAIGLISAEIVILNGKPHVLAVICDVTKSRIIEDKLRESEQRYRILTEQTPLGIWQLDLDGRILYANPAMCTILDVKGPEELTNETYHAYIESDHLEKLEAERARGWGGFMSNYELELVSKSGQKRSVIMSGGPVLSPKGEHNSLIGAFADITERKLAEKALQRTARLSAIGEIAAGVAHQINNPLFTVITDSYLLLEQLPLDHPAYESAAAIQRAASRAGKVVQRLLDFSRAQMFTTQPVDVNTSIRQAIDLIRVQIESQIIQLIVNLSPHLPMVEASEEYLQEVWINLLLNARDAVSQSENAIIQITTTHNTENRMIEVAVEDNGRGISEEEQAQIFTPFFTTKPHGTGLGLTVCYDIVRNHGGSIAVDSVLGRGTVFTVFLCASG